MHGNVEGAVPPPPSCTRATVLLVFSPIVHQRQRRQQQHCHHHQHALCTRTAALQSSTKINDTLQKLEVMIQLYRSAVDLPNMSIYDLPVCAGGERTRGGGRGRDGGGLEVAG